MNIKITTDGLKQTTSREYLVRFVFGGAVTAMAGIIAKEFGPVVGGLFLGFPAILPATATLVETHEQDKKERKGLHGKDRGRKAACIDSAGAAIGSIGLLVFAVVVLYFLGNHSVSLVLTGATLAWLAVSVLLWKARKKIRKYTTLNSRTSRPEKNHQVPHDVEPGVRS